ncbi:hypothetical protein BT93_L0560 [Corymbia citriodora subsp. variegata]|uniref:Uncharacterized protein n=1 Tax=Corymbia citriodora subsp. variegata TaxID=360336 RepID=A0A8T0CX58_CORYI|nr:hypothetical protein BT93_L0560 [Corymbia citriodora subsp. variegata]
MSEVFGEELAANRSISAHLTSFCAAVGIFYSFDSTVKANPVRPSNNFGYHAHYYKGKKFTGYDATSPTTEPGIFFRESILKMGKTFSNARHPRPNVSSCK